MNTKAEQSTRMYGIVKHVNEKGDWGFVSNVMHVDGDTFLHCTNYGEDGDIVPSLGKWVEYDFDLGPKGARALNACPCDLGQEELMHRLRAQYGRAMLNNVGSLRLDGLTMSEAKDILSLGLMTLQEYYARMSENGLKEVARHKNVEFIPGQQLEVAAAIVSAIEAEEAGQGAAVVG